MKWSQIDNVLQLKDDVFDKIAMIVWNHTLSIDNPLGWDVVCEQRRSNPNIMYSEYMYMIDTVNTSYAIDVV